MSVVGGCCCSFFSDLVVILWIDMWLFLPVITHQISKLWMTNFNSHAETWHLHNMLGALMWGYFARDFWGFGASCHGFLVVCLCGNGGRSSGRFKGLPNSCFKSFKWICWRSKWGSWANYRGFTHVKTLEVYEYDEFWHGRSPYSP